VEGPASDFVQPTCPEEKHAQKPTWRRGYRQFGKTEYLLATLTPSDCSTKRLRPPREWYDSLLGASHMSFVAGAQAPDGAPVSFLLKAHAYSYVPAEYYIQVGGLAGVGWGQGQGQGLFVAPARRPAQTADAPTAGCPFLLLEPAGW
jgi:hypothetical protein